MKWTRTDDRFYATTRKEMKPMARSSKIGGKEIQSMGFGRLEVKRPVAQGHTRYERELPAEAVVHEQCGVSQLLLCIPAGGDNTARDNLGHGDGGDGGNDDLFKALPADGVRWSPASTSPTDTEKKQQQIHVHRKQLLSPHVVC